MKGQKIPKATMNSFIKQKVGESKLKITNQFLDSMLLTNYIERVSAKANQICLNQGKKTISNEHFFKAILQLKLGSQLNILKAIEKDVKNQHQNKLEIKNRISNLQGTQEKKKLSKEIIKQDSCIKIMNVINQNPFKSQKSQQDYQM